MRRRTKENETALRAETLGTFSKDYVPFAEHYWRRLMLRKWRLPSNAPQTALNTIEIAALCSANAPGGGAPDGTAKLRA